MTNAEIFEGLQNFFDLGDTEISEILGYGDYMVQEHLSSHVNHQDLADPKTKFYVELRAEMKRRGKV